MHSELKNRIPFTIKISQKNMKITIEKKTHVSFESIPLL